MTLNIKRLGETFSNLYKATNMHNTDLFYQTGLDFFFF